MERFLKRHQGRHSGSIAGFDRLLFRGILRSISYVEGLNPRPGKKLRDSCSPFLNGTHCL
jgi:hypothetical protein